VSASNVFVTVPNPDRLIAGNDPTAPFVVAAVELYRYTTEAIARADTSGSGGTLVTTFTLIAASAPLTDEEGPFRFGYYDSGALGTSYYRYRFRDSGSASFSDLSEPWPISNAPDITVRELMYEIGTVLGDSVKRGTASAGALGTVTCTGIFKSSVVDARWYRGAFLYVEQDAGAAGAAPEGEERIIASVATGTGIATVDNDYSVAPATGDIIQVHSYAPPSEILRCLNRVRERMFLTRHHKLAVNRTTGAGNRYPLPPGVRSKRDIEDVRVVQRFSGSDWTSVAETQYEVEFDGIVGELVFFSLPEQDVVDVVYAQSYREFEGLLALPSDTTAAPLDWLRKATAWEVYRWIYDGEDNVSSRFGSRMGMTQPEVEALSGRYAPSIVRRLSTGHREPIGPRRGAY